MSAGLPDLVDCARLAADAEALQRVYELAELPRLQDLLADTRGILSASFVFTKLSSGRSGAAVAIAATPRLRCQRCLEGFDLSVNGGSEIEFATANEPDAAASEREYFRMNNGQVSLRGLAEEELLLALPLAPKCATPSTCGRALLQARGEGTPGVTGEMRRPFSALQDLLKKT
jgi:uncharacterized protein